MVSHSLHIICVFVWAWLCVWSRLRPSRIAVWVYGEAGAGMIWCISHTHQHRGAALQSSLQPRAASIGCFRVAVTACTPVTTCVPCVRKSLSAPKCTGHVCVAATNDTTSQLQIKCYTVSRSLHAFICRLSHHTHTYAAHTYAVHTHTHEYAFFEFFLLVLSLLDS